MNLSKDLSLDENNPLRLKIIRELDNIQKKRESISELIFKGCTNPREAFNPLMTELTETNRTLSAIQKEIMGNDFLDKDTLVDRLIVNQECAIKVTSEYRNFDNGKKTYPEFSQSVMTILTMTEEKEKRKNIIKIQTQKPLLVEGTNMSTPTLSFTSSSNLPTNLTSNKPNTHSIFGSISSSTITPSYTSNSNQSTTSSSHHTIFGPQNDKVTISTLTTENINTNPSSNINKRSSIQFDDLLGIGSEVIEIKKQQTPTAQKKFDDFGPFGNDKATRKTSDSFFDSFGTKKSGATDNSKAFSDFSDFGSTKNSDNQKFTSFESFSGFADTGSSSKTGSGKKGQNPISENENAQQLKKTQSMTVETKPERHSVGFLNKDPNLGIEKIERKGSDSNLKSHDAKASSDKFKEVDAYMNSRGKESGTEANKDKKEDIDVTRKKSVSVSESGNKTESKEPKPAESNFDANVMEIIAAQKRFIESTKAAQENKSDTSKESVPKTEEKSKPEVKIEEEKLVEKTPKPEEKKSVPETEKEKKFEEPVKEVKSEKEEAEKTPEKSPEKSPSKEKSKPEVKEVPKEETATKSETVKSQDNSSNQVKESEVTKSEEKTENATEQSTEAKTEKLAEAETAPKTESTAKAGTDELGWAEQIDVLLSKKSSDKLEAKSPDIQTKESESPSKIPERKEDRSPEKGESAKKEEIPVKPSSPITTKKDEKVSPTKKPVIEEESEKKNTIQEEEAPKPEAPKEVIKLEDPISLKSEMKSIRDDLKDIKHDIASVKEFINQELSFRDKRLDSLTCDIQILRDEMNLGIKQILEILTKQNKVEESKSS